MLGGGCEGGCFGGSIFINIRKKRENFSLVLGCE